MRVRQRNRSASKLPSWRLVAAAFLHFGIIGYLAFVIPLSLLLAPAGTGAAGLVRLVLTLSGVFLAGFLVLGVGAMTIVALLERWMPRKSRHSSPEAALSQDRVARASDAARRTLDPTAHGVIAAIAGRAWDHDDHRYQALARDLDIVVRTAVRALATLPASDAKPLAQQTAMSLHTIDQALAELEQDRARAAASDAHAAALYIERRYGASDFAIKSD